MIISCYFLRGNLGSPPTYSIVQFFTIINKAFLVSSYHFFSETISAHVFVGFGSSSYPGGG